MYDKNTDTKIATQDVKSKPLFRHEDIKATLTDELLQVIEIQAQGYGVELPKEQSSLMKTSIEIDSLSVVEILCALDEFVGFELKADGVVKRGGYNSVNEAVSHIMPGIEKAWTKQNKGKS